MRDEDKHLLAVAIECDLYDILSEIEKSDMENRKTLKEELINNFINSYRKSFPDITKKEFKEYINFVLERTRKNSEDLTKDELDDER